MRAERSWSATRAGLLRLARERLDDQASRYGADAVVFALGDPGEFSGQTTVDPEVEGWSGSLQIGGHGTDYSRTPRRA
jgi:hypothetical protein